MLSGLTERLRFRGQWLSLALLVGVTGGVAIARLPCGPEPSMPNVVDTGDAHDGTLYSCGHSTARPGALRAWLAAARAEADLMYRDESFGHAARLAWRAKDLARAHYGAADERSVDLANLAVQYQKLHDAWLVAFDPDASAIDALPAAREAWKLDTVLGGVHGEVLLERLGTIATRAAFEFFAKDQLAEADEALETAALLGVDTEETRRLDRQIAKRRR